MAPKVRLFFAMYIVAMIYRSWGLIVRLKLQGQTMRNYELTANTRNVLKAGADTSKNYERKSAYILDVWYALSKDDKGKKTLLEKVH